MDVPPSWFSCGLATRIRKTRTKAQIKATKKRRALESAIEDQRVAKELGMTLEEFQAQTGGGLTPEDVI